MTAETTRLTGDEAITTAAREGLTLSKCADPTEGARDGLSVEEAREIARVDPGLIYLDVTPATRDIVVIVEAGQAPIWAAGETEEAAWAEAEGYAKSEGLDLSDLEAVVIPWPVDAALPDGSDREARALASDAGVPA